MAKISRDGHESAAVLPRNDDDDDDFIANQTGGRNGILTVRILLWLLNKI